MNITQRARSEYRLIGNRHFDKKSPQQNEADRIKNLARAKERGEKKRINSLFWKSEL